MTVAEYLEHWLTIGGSWAAKTAARHRGIIHKNIIPRLGKVPMRKLTATHIEAFEAELKREGRQRHRDARGEGLTAQTVLHVHRTLSQALAHAVKTEVLFRNPAKQVKPPRPPGREIKILTKPEIGTVLRSLAGKPLYVPVLLAVTSGMRRGEIFGLRWSDIDLGRSQLTVNQSLEYVGKPPVATFKPPKTKASRRMITLPALTIEALKAHRSEQAAERLRLGLGKPELVFTRADWRTGQHRLRNPRLWRTDRGAWGDANHVPRPAPYPHLAPAYGWGSRQAGERKGRARQHQRYAQRLRRVPAEPPRQSSGGR
jgi:integrase